MIGEGGRLVVSGELTPGTVLTVLFAIIIGAFSLGTLGPRIEAFAKASAASHTIFQTLERIPTIDSLADSGERPVGIRGTWELKGVSFIYPSRPEGRASVDYSHDSHRFKRYQRLHSGREVHGDSRTIGLREVHNFATS